MYVSFYQLSEEPFRLTPDPRFLHLAEPHRAALTTLIHGVVFRKGLIVATGPVGTGKTTLLHALLQLLTERLFRNAPLASAFLINPTLSRDEFWEALLDEFEIPCDVSSKPRRMAALHQMLIDYQSRKGTAVLLVDEAHLLSLDLLEEIRLLGNMDTYRGKPLQVILSGQTELLLRLARPELRALKQRVASRCQLRPLSLAEAREYIAERLHTARLQGPSPFSAHAVEEIHRCAQGVPRLINLLGDACLSIGQATQRRRIESDIVQQAAENLGLPEACVPEPAKDLPVVSTSVSKPSGSAVEMLIEAMRQGRANVRSQS